MKALRGRTALLTGAGGGLGRYIARALAAEGVDVALCDLPSVSVGDLRSELRQRGVSAESIPADLTDTAGLEALVRHAEDAIGPLDILVNNAGVEFGGAYTRQTRAELETIASVNLLAMMELIRIVIPPMLERGGGHVVNLASLAGKVPFPFAASYSATKYGVVGLTHSLRVEYADAPISFSAICPTFIGRVGMYGRLESELPDPPRAIGKLPPERVGEAVVKAIRDDRAEIMVTPASGRPLAGVAAAFPGLATKLSARGSLRDFAARYARALGRE
jgi:NAD(P)-dependent dehydrogenase (short-subunit alcohol dehydrogenase family)